VKQALSDRQGTPCPAWQWCRRWLTERINFVEPDADAARTWQAVQAWETLKLNTTVPPRRWHPINPATYLERLRASFDSE
jgi:hypothetical protein